MRYGLKDSVVEAFCGVFEKYSEVEEVIIYGSRAKDTYRPGSDIDITLMGKNITHDIRSNIALDLDELNTPYLIDLSVFHKLNSVSLIDHINRVGKTFYKRESILK